MAASSSAVDGEASSSVAAGEANGSKTRLPTRVLPGTFLTSFALPARLRVQSISPSRTFSSSFEDIPACAIADLEKKRQTFKSSEGKKERKKDASPGRDEKKGNVPPRSVLAGLLCVCGCFYFDSLLRCSVSSVSPEAPLPPPSVVVVMVVVPSQHFPNNQASHSSGRDRPCTGVRSSRRGDDDGLLIDHLRRRLLIDHLGRLLVNDLRRRGHAGCSGRVARGVRRRVAGCKRMKNEGVKRHRAGRRKSGEGAANGRNRQLTRVMSRRRSDGHSRSRGVRAWGIRARGRVVRLKDEGRRTKKRRSRAKG